MTPKEQTELWVAAREIMRREPTEGEGERMEFAVDWLRRLTTEEFQTVMSFFCRECGGAPKCQCWNDE